MYKGEFKDDKFNGKGYLRTANGEYNGEWKDGDMNGIGSYRLANGD